jgi:RNA polymerase sigma-70 factor (ECF subfamily)
LYTQHELEQTIQQALNSLDPDQRAAVVLVDLYELCYQEAMKVLHIPLGTLKSRLARGRARLRQLLNHQDCDEV